MRKAWVIWSALTLGIALSLIQITAVVAKDRVPKVEFESSEVAPRSVEDATRAAIVRDYSLAWQSLAAAMDQNRADLLDSAFVGMAREKFAQGIAEQQKTGLHRRYSDRGHRLEAAFYSYDGSALQLKDTAQVEVQLLDGDRVVATESVATQFVVLMTPAENSWKVRDIAAVPSF